MIAETIKWIKGTRLYNGKFEDFEIYHHFTQASPDADEPKFLILSGHYVPANRNDFVISFVGNPNLGEPTGCELSYVLMEKLHVRISFSGKQLEKHQAIREAVSKLVSSFVVQ